MSAFAATNRSLAASPQINVIPADDRIRLPEPESLREGELAEPSEQLPDGKRGLVKRGAMQGGAG
jgi:hypothetical protein